VYVVISLTKFWSFCWHWEALHMLLDTLPWSKIVVMTSGLTELFSTTWLTLWRPLLQYGWASECPDVKNYKWRLNPVWHRMLYSCTHIATVGVKGLTSSIHRGNGMNSGEYYGPRPLNYPYFYSFSNLLIRSLMYAVGRPETWRLQCW